MKVFSRHHWRGYVLDEIIYWSEVDEKSDIILSEEMSGDVCSSSLAFQERWAGRLNDYVVLLGDLEDSLICEVVADFLHYALELMAVSGYGSLSGCRSLR